MHTSSLLMLGVTTVITFFGRSAALGINCRGSGLCDRASLSSSSGKIVQILRDAVWASSKDNSTTYGAGAHSSYSTNPFSWHSCHSNESNADTEIAQSSVSVRQTRSPLRHPLVLKPRALQESSVLVATSALELAVYVSIWSISCAILLTLFALRNAGNLIQVWRLFESRITC